jgi:hypothetical protein
MKRCLFVLVGIFLIASHANAEQPDCSQFKAFKGTMDRYYKLVAPWTYDIQPAMEEISKNPLAASCFLVRDLKPVRQKKLTSVQAYSVKPIWALRGLRYLTNCKDFSGRLIHQESIDPKDARGNFLLRNGAEKVPFFSTWMSRDISFIAPVEVQQQVILKWQDWYTSEASSFSYQQCGSIDEWYF